MRPRAVILGGGLAGIAAAEILAYAQFDVTLLESASVLGGKVQGWHGDDGREYEHGIHGFWPNYLNLFALFERAGIDKEKFFRQARSTTTVIPGEGKYENRPLQTRLPPPLHVLVHLLRTPYLRWVDKLSVLRAASEILAFDHKTDYAEYDELTFRGWLWTKGVSLRAYQRLFEPYNRALTFDSASRVSAAAALSSLQLYVLRGQHDLEPLWLKRNPGELFGHLRDYLQGLGVKIKTGAGVTTLLLDEGRIKAIGYKPDQDPTRWEGELFREMLKVGKDEIKDNVPITKQPPLPWPAVHLIRQGDELFAFDSTCTHNMNRTYFSGTKFNCPTHDSTFDLSGKRLSGPAVYDLKKLQVRKTPEGWSVGLDDAVLYLSADYFVSALNLSSLQKILTSDFLAYPDFRGIETLETAPVMVGRFWFTGELEVEEGTSGFFVGDTLVDTYFVVSNRSEGEIVIEAQAYLVRDTVHLDSEILKDLFLQDLRTAIPQLRNLLLVQKSIQKFPDLFSLYEAGSNALRPGTLTSVSNLFLAGDWIHVDAPVWNMERAVVSGVLAAQAAVRKWGRDPDRPDDPLSKLAIQALPQPAPVYSRLQRAAAAVRHFSRWWRQFRRSAPQIPTCLRDTFKNLRDGFTERLRCQIAVRKFPGTPQEELVQGTIDFEVKALALVHNAGPRVRVTGTFIVDLASISTGIGERDTRVRQVLLNVQRDRYVDVEIANFRRLTKDDEDNFKMDIEVSIGDRHDSLPATATRKGLSSNSMSAIHVSMNVIPSSLGYDTTALQPVCGAVIEDSVRIETWIAVPRWIVATVDTPVAQSKKSDKALRLPIPVKSLKFDFESDLALGGESGKRQLPSSEPLPKAPDTELFSIQPQDERELQEWKNPKS